MLNIYKKETPDWKLLDIKSENISVKIWLIFFSRLSTNHSAEHRFGVSGSKQTNISTFIGRTVKIKARFHIQSVAFCPTDLVEY